MREIRSGSSTKRVVRAAVVVLIVNVFAVLFLWDGFIRYPVANAVQLAKTLGLPLPVPPPIHPELTDVSSVVFIGEWQKGSGTEPLVLRWGEPAFRHEGVWYFLGAGGHLAARIVGDSVEKLEWHEGVHGDADLVWQRIIGAALAVVGVLCLVKLVRTVMSFATLSAEGLHVSGHRNIGWEQMVAVAMPPKDKYRRVALTYMVDGRERCLLLDDDVIRDRDAIVAAICERKGFALPVAYSSELA